MKIFIRRYFTCERARVYPNNTTHAVLIKSQELCQMVVPLVLGSAGMSNNNIKTKKKEKKTNSKAIANEEMQKNKK